MKRSSSLILLVIFSWALCGAGFPFLDKIQPKAVELYQKFCERWLGTEPAQPENRVDEAFLLRLGGYTDTLLNYDLTGFYEGEKLLFKPDAPLSEIGRLLHIDAKYNKTGRMITLPEATLEVSVTPNGIYAWDMGFPIQRNPGVIDLVDRIRHYGLMDRFFFANPNLSEDVMLQLSTAHLTKRNMRKIGMDRAIADDQHDLYIFSEVPGTDGGARAVETLVRSRHMEWVALEGFTIEMQSLLDAYTYSPADSEDSRHAWDGIQQYIENWKEFFPELATNGAHYYLEILKTCRDYGVRVVGIETTPLQHSPFKLKTRNRLWAINTTPKRGVGIVYGQRKHFEDSLGANFQDFLSLEHNPVFVRH